MRDVSVIAVGKEPLAKMVHVGTIKAMTPLVERVRRFYKRVISISPNSSITDMFLLLKKSFFFARPFHNQLVTHLC